MGHFPDRAPAECDVQSPLVIGDAQLDTVFGAVSDGIAAHASAS